tara:strand:- start:618 stop:755 length:138 start_codon:yes stop_codon:yes gene_type:complete
MDINGIDKKTLAKFGITAGLVLVLAVAYYTTGIYKHYKQIKKIDE